MNKNAEFLRVINLYQTLSPKVLESNKYYFVQYKIALEFLQIEAEMLLYLILRSKRPVKLQLNYLPKLRQQHNFRKQVKNNILKRF